VEAAQSFLLVDSDSIVVVDDDKQRGGDDDQLLAPAASMDIDDFGTKMISLAGRRLIAKVLRRFNIPIYHHKARESERERERERECVCESYQVAAWCGASVQK
jgi:hypothetical protein